MNKIENCNFRPRRSDVSDVRVADPGRLRRLFPAEPLRDEVIPWPPGGRYIKQIIIVIIFCLKKTSTPGHPPPPSTSASASGSLLSNSGTLLRPPPPPSSGLQSPSLPQVHGSDLKFTNTHNLSDVPSRLLELRPNVLQLLRQAGPAGDGCRAGSRFSLPAQHVQPHPLLPGWVRALPGRCRGTRSTWPLPSSVRVPDAHAQIGGA